MRNRRKRPAILVVENEPTERQAIEEALLHAGHRVVVEADIPRASELLRTSTYPLAALITAVELDRGQHGWRLASLARQLRPAIPIVYLTWFSGEAWGVHGVPGSVLLHKPVNRSELAASVKLLLRQGCEGAAAPL